MISCPSHPSVMCHALAGPFNIQFICKDNEVKVIECNLRASRSMPFISKTYNAAFMNLYGTCSLYFFVTLNDCSQLLSKYADGPSRLHKAPKVRQHSPLKVNFIELATRIMTGFPVHPAIIQPMDIDYVACKCPMFSFGRLKNSDPRLGVEMSSTGEVACFGVNVHEAFLKGTLTTVGKRP